MSKNLKFVVAVLALWVAACPRPGNVKHRPTEMISYAVDPAIHPPPGTLDGARPVAAIQDQAGVVTRFVENEVRLRPRSRAELDAFLARYRGTLAGSDAVPEPPARLGIRMAPAFREPTEYLVKLEPGAFDPRAFATDAGRIGLIGAFKLSSERGLRLMALIAHEAAAGLVVSPNFVYEGHAVLLNTRERPAGVATFDDAFGALFPRFQNTGSRSSVVQAWQWMRPRGIVRRTTVAIIDGGFWLNATGNPLTAPGDGSDLPNNPIQYDFVGDDFIAGPMNPSTCTGGAPCPWHGNGSAGVAIGIVNNQVAAAGTGGTVADPMLFHVSLDWRTVHRAVRTAVAWGADVVNMSFGGPCNTACRIYERDDDVYADAAGAGLVLVASAGNSSIDVGADNFVHPCINDGVICVGALTDNTNTRNPISNFGGGVDIWAPTNIRVMSDPTAVMPSFGGTSASSPFVAGIAAMLKAINPALNTEQVRTLLRDSAWTDSPDGNVTHYVNALQAVRRASNNVLPPDRFEVNDAQASSTAIALGQQDDMNVHAGNELDQYRFSTGGPTTATLDFTYPDGLGKVGLVNYGLHTERACGYTEQQSDQVRANGRRIMYRLPAGTFRFALNGGGAALPYDLNLAFSGAMIAPDIYEPNNTHAQRRLLGDGGYIRATLHTASDVDFFQFTSRGNFQTMVMDLWSGVEVRSSDGPLTLTIFDTAGNFRTSVSSSANCSTLATVRVPAGQWVARVSGNGPGAYSLWLGSAGEQHPLLSIKTLIYLLLHPNVPRELPVSGPETWTIVEKRSGRPLREITLHTPGVHLTLYNERGEVIAEGVPTVLRGVNGETLTLERGGAGSHYLLRVSRASDGALAGIAPRRLAIIPARLELVER